MYRLKTKGSKLHTLPFAPPPFSFEPGGHHLATRLLRKFIIAHLVAFFIGQSCAIILFQETQQEIISIPCVLLLPSVSVGSTDMSNFPQAVLKSEFFRFHYVIHFQKTEYAQTDFMLYSRAPVSSYNSRFAVSIMFSPCSL